MHLPFFGTSALKKILYTIQINESTIHAASWHVVENMPVVDSVSEVFSWDEQQSDTLFDACDEALGQVDTGGQEVLLSLPEDWVQGQVIHPKRKPLLKHLLNRLEMHSVGFVVTMEAVLASLQIEQTKPMHAIYVGVEADALLIAVAVQGAISPILRVGRSGDSRQDLLEACARLKLEQLPGQIQVFSFIQESADEPTVYAQLSQGEWNSGVFVQEPVVENYDNEHVLHAVTKAGGREVILSIPTLQSQSPKNATQTDADFAPVQPPDQNLQDGEVGDLSAPQTSQKIRKFLLGAGIILGILLFCLICLSLFAHRIVQMTLTLQKKSESVSQDVHVLISSTEVKNEQLPVVTARLQPLSLQLEDTVPVTGKKEVGEQAKGRVFIFNKTLQVKKFPKGTVLASNSIRFTTDSDVTVASASSTITQTINGKESVQVTAVQFGESGNIPKDTLMSVGSFDASAYVAQSDTAFSGGTSSTVLAVSQKDVDTAVSKIMPRAKQALQEKLKEFLSPGQQGIALDTLSLTQKRLSSQIGQEAKDLTVSLTASSAALLFESSTIDSLILQQLTAGLEPGSSLVTDSIQYSPVSQKKKTATLFEQIFHVEAQKTTGIDSSKYAQVLSGKTLAQARDFLEKQENFSAYSITFSPKWMSIFVRKLPFDAERIRIELVR